MVENSIRDKFFYLRDKIIENRYKELNKEQISAVLSEENNLAVIACPGAGKTTTLIRRVDYLVTFGFIYNTDYCPEEITTSDLNILEDYLNYNKGNTRLNYLLRQKAISANNIIIITFTRAAAKNMKKRYKALGNHKRTPFFGTFHGLFYKILSRTEEKIDIINTAISYKLIKGVLSTYLDEISDEKVKETLNAISFYKTLTDSKENFNPNMDRDIFLECYRTYEDFKLKNNLMDFDDLQLRCKSMFMKNMRVLNGYKNLFKYILVDEFQDCDGIQIEILKLLNEGNSIFAVGDEDQCIYGFRGSKPECMVNFDKHFKNGKKLFLSTNYRCPKSIVKVSDNLIKNNKMRNDKKFKSSKEDMSKINVMNYKNEREQADSIAMNITKLMSIGDYNYEDNAILYRTNVESRSIIDSFIRKKIPFKLLDKEYNFFEHFICKDIIAYLKLSINSSDKESFLRIINKPFRYISKVNLGKVRKDNSGDDCFDALKDNEKIPPFQLKKIDEVKKDIQNLNRMSLSGAINSVLHTLDYYDYLKDYSKKFKLDITELEEILEEFISASQDYTTIITFLAHISEVKDEIKNNKNNEEKSGVILSTIHGVKGMEFKNVFIINCNEENIPHINSIDENLEEERRLFYVGVTRTIENLWVCICNEIRGKNKSASRFIKECNLTVIFNDLFKKDEIVFHKSFGKGKITSIDDNKIEIEFQNNIKRSFDSLILYNNGLVEKLV
ncbi:ATP-dependent helicase [Clostridium massiliodielmoense]|uniref:ATP-dependent helicase n=1 Tax=Clostridium massiliodielmoense TaxID=1776385 RepID=UPI000A271449|nr:ATP-dependent helicase [Clostridium massiliodielmoense]